MSNESDGPERRREAFEEGLEKAREGAQKAAAGARRLAGWLGHRVSQAAEHVKGSEPVREKLAQWDEFRAGRAQDRRAEALAAAYDDWAARLQETLDALTAEADQCDHSIDAINVNINELRLRGTAEDDAELADYRRQVADLRATREAIRAAREPFQDELDRLVRHGRAALARLEADPEQLPTLQAEAAQQVADSAARINALASPAPEPGETTKE